MIACLGSEHVAGVCAHKISSWKAGKDIVLTCWGLCFFCFFQAQKNERESIRQKLALGSFFDDGPGIYTSCSKSGKPSLSSRWASGSVSERFSIFHCTKWLSLNRLCHNIIQFSHAREGHFLVCSRQILQSDRNAKFPVSHIEDVKSVLGTSAAGRWNDAHFIGVFVAFSSRV